MAYDYTQFANDTTPALPDLDENFSLFSVLAPIPCTISGTNALTFTQNDAGQATSLPLVVYENQVQICGIATGTNTTAVTARLGALPALPVYKDTISGPAALTGSEIVTGNSLTLRYDSSLDSGNGGWHLVSGQQGVGNTINPSLVRASVGLQVGATTTPTLTGLLSTSSVVAFTAMVPGATQDATIAFSGVSVTDALCLGFPLPVSTGLTYSGYIAAAGTVIARAANVTPASTITPGTITVQAKALRTT